MTEKYKYETILIKGPGLGVFAEFPFESAKIFGTRKAVRVKATFEGKMFRMSLLPRGNGTHWLHLRKEIRDAIGKDEGDTVSICIEKDENPPTIKVPEYLNWLLENEPDMMKKFNRLTRATKKFWVEFIEEVKSEEVKVQRINRLFDFLHNRNSGKL